MDQDYFTVMVFFKASPSQQRRVLDINIDDTEDKIRHMPGFVGAAFLKSLDGERVTEYIQWRSEEHLREAMKDPRFFEHIPEVRKIAEDEFSPYEVYCVDKADPRAEHGTVEISNAADLLTAVARFAVKPGKQSELLRLLVEPQDHLLPDVPGFLAKSVLRSPDGASAVEYTQFEGREAFDAFGERSKASAYQEKVAELARAEISVYEVDFVSTAAGGGQGAAT
jgi:heme-degrading monooxygenase HmoA